MPQNANSVKTAHARQLRLIPETTPGTYDPAGAPIMAADIAGSITVKPVQEFQGHTPQGTNGSSYVAKHSEHSEIASLSIEPDYVQARKWLDMTFKLFAKTTAGGKDTYEYRKAPIGTPQLGAYTIEAGEPASCDRMPYGLLGSLELSSGRKKPPSGSVSLMGRKRTRRVAMTGSVAQNEIQTIISSGAYGGGTVTFTGPANAVSLTGGASLASIQAAIATAFSVTNGDIVVTGTSTAAVSGITITNAPSSAYNGLYVYGGQSNGANWYHLNNTHFLYLAGATGNWFIGTILASTGTWTYNAAGSAPTPPITNTLWTQSGATPTNVSPMASAFGAASGASLNLVLTLSGATASNRSWTLGMSNLGSVVVARTQAGSTGVLNPLAPAPITASDWTIRRAATLATLANAGSLIDSAFQYSIKVDDVSKPHYTANGSETFDRHQVGKCSITASFQMDDLDSGHCTALESSVDTTTRVATPFWYEFGHRSGDGNFALLWQSFLALDAAIEPQDNEDAYSQQFSLEEILYPGDAVYSTRVLLTMPANTFAD